ncbi:hypothetical protein [Nocardioides sp.]|uniref:hypothetical protein n=1 Tax=Nocardioides sp. TaxID=35761 RepID=UPI001A32A0B3|nr:hypothetical protein [Nocardioides sp.]MBJ7357258.1 hypothetical protein [Nocardioides sp.]
MRAADELQPPVGYDDRWLVLALLALAVVAVYYAAVLWWTRARPPRLVPAGPQTGWVARLDEISAAVARGDLTARRGHQEISRTVREFVAERSGVPAATMTLDDFRDLGPERVAELVALTYPPSFSADEELPGTAFDEAARRARTLVTTWT